jgi:hypothetical protein
LLAKAVHQPHMYRLTRRLREQARSHIWISTRLQIAAKSRGFNG